MEEMNTGNLEESVKGWKGKIQEVNKGSLTWDKDLIFNARTQRGYEIEFDAEIQWGCAPTETLIMSLAGCLAIDMVFFLKKMRAEITSFVIDYDGKRNPDPPQYYKSIEMMIKVSGSGLTPKKLERAISLSQEKYCSVYHSLRNDIEVKVDYTIGESGD
ncbi:MAG TPA: OsmC family peroxiredoxin [Nitrospirae bacterium]|nr:OsmC family peroxiredoxin [Nitrospirota bacterium]